MEGKPLDFGCLKLANSRGWTVAHELAFSQADEPVYRLFRDAESEPAKHEKESKIYYSLTTKNGLTVRDIDFLANGLMEAGPPGRTARLFKLAREDRMSGEHLKISRAAAVLGVRLSEFRKLMARPDFPRGFYVTNKDLGWAKAALEAFSRKLAAEAEKGTK
jgi:predicted DNA-binding transcriptional regulator AlpA